MCVDVKKKKKSYCTDLFIGLFVFCFEVNNIRANYFGLLLDEIQIAILFFIFLFVCVF